MNKEKLEKVFNHLLGLDSNLFTMTVYNRGVPIDDTWNSTPDMILEILSQPCGSVGCVIGHSICLDNKENILKHVYKRTESNYGFNFLDWSIEFFELDDLTTDNPSITWNWFFSDVWSWIDDTPLGAAKRIAYYLEHGVNTKLLQLVSDNEDINEEINAELDKLLLPFYKRLIAFKNEDESLHHEWADYIAHVSETVDEPVKTGVITDYMFFIILGDYHLMGTWSEDEVGFVSYIIKDNKVYTSEQFIIANHLSVDTCDWEKSKKVSVDTILKLKYGNLKRS